MRKEWPKGGDVGKTRGMVRYQSSKVLARVSEEIAYDLAERLARTPRWRLLRRRILQREIKRYEDDAKVFRLLGRVDY